MSDSTIKFSTFERATDGVPRSHAATWDQFVAGLGPHKFHISDKKSCPMFSPAEFRSGATSRTASNVSRIWFAVLDLDMITNAQLLGVCQKLEGLDAVLYTTWNHPEVFSTSLRDPRPARRGLWKIRVCIRLSRPVEVVEWPAFWLSLTAYFDNLNDIHCKDPCRCYFGAFAPPGSPPELCHFIVFPGEGLDVSSLAVQPMSPPLAGTDRVRRDRLKKIASSWKKSKNHYRSELGETLMKVCDGEAFAEHGNRDTTAFRLCADLARELPHGDPASVAEHFRQSIDVMPGTKLTVDAIRDKFERAQVNAASEAMAKEMSAAAEAKLWIRDAFKHIDPTRDYPYTEPDLDMMAAKMECTREEMSKRWLIQRGMLYYVLGPDAVYSKPYSEKDITVAVCRDLAPASSAGVELSMETEKGKVYKSAQQLVREYGTVAVDYVLDLRAQEARYDASEKLFIEAPCPLRNLVPTYDKDVAAWLEILAGPAHEDLLNWLAWCTDLDQTSVALFMTGAPDTGMSLLAYGVSRLWTKSGPTKLSSALDSFNDSIAACPLIFADEKLPTDYRGRGRTAEIREFIADHARPFKKKFCPETRILGATRLIVAANNDNVMSIQEHLTMNDIKAISERFFHFRVQDAAAAFLKMVDTVRFVEGDAIAKHVLWLRDNYPRRREGRFLIKPRDLEFFSGLTTRSGIRSAVLQWLVGYLKLPGRMDSRGDLGVRVHKCGLWVRPEAILQCWSTYVSTGFAPDAGALGTVVVELSTDRTRIPVSGKIAQNYRKIDINHLYAWGERTEFMTREEIDEALKLDTTMRVKKYG